MKTWYVAFVIVFVIRCVIAGMLFMRGDGVGLVYAMFEAAQLTLSAWNALFAREFDTRLVGLAVPVCYMLGALTLPAPGTFNVLSANLVFVAFMLNCWSLRHLLGRVTTAASSWRSLVDTGPYRFLRHPQAFSRLLVIAALLVTGGDFVFALRVGVCVALVLIIIDVEESFLKSIPEYSDYASRVRYRVLPLVY